MAKRVTRAPAGASMEERILAIVNGDADITRTRSQMAKVLHVKVDEVRGPLDALVTRGLVRCARVGTNLIFSAKKNEPERVPKIVGRGELKGDYNGVMRHWSLCMEARR